MLKGKFSQPKSTHSVKGVETEKEFIFTCEKCDYRRVENKETGEDKVTGMNSGINHSGSYSNEAYFKNLSLFLEKCDISENGNHD